MWLSQRLTRKQEESAAQLAVTTIGGPLPAVSGGAERRDAAVFAPGGYFWRPGAGETVLVIKTGGSALVAGARSPDAGLEAGEVRIESAGGAAICLRNSGRVELEGALYINGEAYVPASAAAEEGGAAV